MPGRIPSISLPQHELLEGIPDARAMFTAKSADQGACAGFWSCDVGRHELVFDYDELIYLIEGEVVVSEAAPSTQSHVLKAGDTAHFPPGDHDDLADHAPDDEVLRRARAKHRRDRLIRTSCASTTRRA
jgi:uncharacterized cupin superfamily protein